ncbi:agmatine deiminase family protein [Pseudonocardia acaciae]|uniref:agmatine deiminase family protein n=1 Tax=Pseudonocardia acaciae TaxID=551276 RepID=UPI00048C1C23|nr:agmatine deiminase family protein [Pseudonocardia acaciae]
MTGLSRRAVLGGVVGAAALGVLAGCQSTPSGPPGGARNGAEPMLMPHESGPHVRTFMSWPSVRSDWGPALEAVRGDLARISQAIARYEPVVMVASPEDVAGAGRACGSAVEVVDLPVDNLWARDSFPKFVAGGGAVAGVDLNFNGWGAKPGINYAHDARAAAGLLAHFGLERRQAPLVSDGGSIETDGLGTLLATESSIVIDNRNPGRTRADIERALLDTFGARTVVWFEGVKGEEITDCHVDTLTRIPSPGVVLLNRPAPGTPPDVWSKVSDQARSVLRDATDARGKPFTVVELPEADPGKIRGGGETFVASYANYYVCNGAVLLPEFGDKQADDRAAGLLREHFPGRDVVQLNIDTLATGDGGIHCATQDQPV